MEDGGKLVISLDLELYWGERRTRRLEACRDEILCARRAVPALLDLFSDYDVRATWPVVGFLFARHKEELLDSLPTTLPAYRDVGRSPYAHIARIGQSERDDPVHYAPTLVRQIAVQPGQEVASHTFSNFYCDQQGQSIDDFRADLEAAIELARRRGIILRSLVVPDNQIPDDYLDICRRLGISSYRGPPGVWPYRGSEDGDLGALRSRLRHWLCTADALMPLTGTRCVEKTPPAARTPVNVAATRQLVPIAGRRQQWLRRLQRWRIFAELDNAARNNRVFHLWGRVRDFARHLSTRRDQLRRLLDRFAHWRDRGQMQSVTMHEIAMGRESRDEHRPPTAAQRL